MKKSLLENINSLLEKEILSVATTLKGEFLAKLKDGERFQTFSLSSKEFTLTLRTYYQKKYHSDLSPNDINDILYYLAPKAYANKLNIELAKRIYNYEDQQIIYDLNRDDGMAVIIEEGECTIELVDEWLFKRNDMFQNQVTPDLSKSVKPKNLTKYVKKHFNLKNRDEVMMFSMYLVSCFWGLTISHPALFLSSEQGSGKSTFLRKLGKIIDPKNIDLTAIPHSADGLELRLSNSYFVALDNLSHVSQSISDILARAITGGSITKRKLYENTEEVSIDIKCILALNSVSMIFKEPDLLDRMYIISLDRFKSSENRPESEIWEEFEKDLPAILGCCFKCLAQALDDKEPIPPVDRIRLADYQDRCIRIGKVLGYSPEEVTQLLFKNQKRINQEAINESIAGQCLIEYMKNHDSYENSVTNLLYMLNKVAVRKHINASMLPKTANHLSRQLNKIKNNLAQEYGISYNIRNVGPHRMIRINKLLENIDNIDDIDDIDDD